MLSVVAPGLLLLEAGLPKKLDPLDPDPINLALMLPVVELPDCVCMAGPRPGAAAASAVEGAWKANWGIQRNYPGTAFSS